MPTYQDVTTRVRALVGDSPNHFADDSYLLPFVNMAQGQLVSHLMSQGVREAVLRSILLVPAGTSRIERWPAQATSPNEIASSDDFAFSAPPAGWASIVGTAVRTTGYADPVGGTDAIRWAIGSGSNFDFYVAGTEVAPALSYNGSGSLWVRTPDTDYPYALRVLTGIADNNGPIAETLAYVDTVLTNEWERVFVPFSSKTITTVVTGTLRRCLEFRITAAAPVAIELFRASLRPAPADSADVKTAGHGTTVGRDARLPEGLVQPDRLLERKPGGGSGNPWAVLRGPVVIRDAIRADRLLQWDWSNGGIDLSAATADRELMIEYWGELRDDSLGSNVVEEELPITGSKEALAAIAAGLLAASRDQPATAAGLGTLQKDGSFGGMAGGLVVNLVNTFQKAQQSEPMRRQPYFGVPRYPGVSGNMIGGWPWTST